MMRKILYFQVSILIIMVLPSCNGKVKPDHNTKYSVINDAIVGKNLGTFNNRPLYVNNSDAFILAGDQPVARLAKDQYLYGTFMLGVIRDGKGKWLQHCDQVTSEYRPGRMLWKISDSSFKGLTIIMETLPMANTTGMAITARADGSMEGDRIIWAFGGAQWKPGQNLAWRWDVTRNTSLLKWDFSPGDCRNNKFETGEDIFFITVPDSTVENDNLFKVAVKCNPETEIRINDATEWIDPVVFSNSQAGPLPVLNGIITPEKGPDDILGF